VDGGEGGEGCSKLCGAVLQVHDPLNSSTERRDQKFWTILHRKRCQKFLYS
jgi:hypothetical protein